MHGTLPRRLDVSRAVDVESSSGREPAGVARDCYNAVNCRAVTGWGMLDAGHLRILILIPVAPRRNVLARPRTAGFCCMAATQYCNSWCE